MPQTALPRNHHRRHEGQTTIVAAEGIIKIVILWSRIERFNRGEIESNNILAPLVCWKTLIVFHVFPNSHLRHYRSV